MELGIEMASLYTTLERAICVALSSLSKLFGKFVWNRHRAHYFAQADHP